MSTSNIVPAPTAGTDAGPVRVLIGTLTGQNYGTGKNILTGGPHANWNDVKAAGYERLAFEYKGNNGSIEVIMSRELLIDRVGPNAEVLFTTPDASNNWYASLRLEALTGGTANILGSNHAANSVDIRVWGIKPQRQVLPANAVTVTRGASGSFSWVETVFADGFKRLEMWGTATTGTSSARVISLPKSYKDNASMYPAITNRIAGSTVYTLSATPSGNGSSITIDAFRDETNSRSAIPCTLYITGEGA